MKRFLLICLTLLCGTSHLWAQSQATTSKNMNLIGHIPYPDNVCNDVWGYVDSTGNEYALLGTILGESIVDLSDPANPTELFFVEGPVSLWRDWKTFGNYAYVSNETANGIRIFDLSGLPGTITHKDTIIMGVATIHNLWIDDKGYLYAVGCNNFNGGMMILDLNADPWNPTFIGAYDETYVHDVYVRGDMAYSAEINEGELTIVDMSDRTQPQILGGTNYLNSFTHNTWLNDAGTVCFSTDELDNAYIYSWDITDPSNIQQLDGIRSSVSNGTATPHNVHVLNDFLVVSYYKDGVVIFDASRPSALVEVGHYDTSPEIGGGIDGAWGAYPFLPSGLILGSDMSEGLFVMQSSYTRASFVEGIVTDAVTGAALKDVQVTISPVGEEIMTNLSGAYDWGTIETGQFQISFAKYGYESQVINFTLGPDTLISQTIQLNPTPRLDLEIQVVEAGSLIPIPDANISATPDSGDVVFEWISDINGVHVENSFVANTYSVYVGKWGYHTKEIYQDFSAGTLTLTVELETGYRDEYVLDLGWELSGTTFEHNWERAIPIGTTFDFNQIAPDADIDGDLGKYAYVIGNIDGDAEFGDLDNEETIITSPEMDLSQYGDPMLRFHWWLVNWNPTLNITAPGSLTVEIFNDFVDAPLATYSTMLGNNWTLTDSVRITDFFPTNLPVRIRFRAQGAFPLHLFEAAIDGFEVFDAMPPTSVEDLVGTDQFQLYPNPLQKSLTIELDVEEYPEGLVLELATIQGQMIQSIPLQAVDRLTMEFPYAPGVYLATLRSEAQILAVRKLIRTP